MLFIMCNLNDEKLLLIKHEMLLIYFNKDYLKMIKTF